MSIYDQNRDYYTMIMVQGRCRGSEIITANPGAFIFANFSGNGNLWYRDYSSENTGFYVPTGPNEDSQNTGCQGLMHTRECNSSLQSECIEGNSAESSLDSSEDDSVSEEILADGSGPILEEARKIIIMGIGKYRRQQDEFKAWVRETIRPVDKDIDQMYVETIDNEPRTYAFVFFDSEQAAELAVTCLSGRKICGEQKFGVRLTHEKVAVDKPSPPNPLAANLHRGVAVGTLMR